MFRRGFIELRYTTRLLAPSFVISQPSNCPASTPARCPGSGGKKVGATTSSGVSQYKLPDIKRLDKCAPCRYCFIPEEWFTFFYQKTGVSGPYIFGLVVWNYWLSKEIFIMEHEYYTGLSIFLILYLATTKLGPEAGKALDKEVDAIVATWQKDREDEIAGYENSIKEAKDAKWRAEGQKLLMDAKKENIAMQLEAAYRERLMFVYRGVTGQMEYHIKRQRSINRIHQRWMVDWILNNVMKSITPEFLDKALAIAIQDLGAAAQRA